MQNKNNPVKEESASKEKSLKVQKCCSECHCSGYDQDHDNICKCGHNSEKHIC